MNVRIPFLRAYPLRWPVLVLVLLLGMPTACTRLVTPDFQPDEAADAVITGLRRTNADLKRFTCVAKMTLSSPNRAVQSFRVAMAGQLSDHLRIDMFAPLGGSAGTVSSDGEYFYLVMHPSREYVKKRLGSGSLKRMIHINISVGDLLEILVGRIPMDASLLPRLAPGAEAAQDELELVDRWGKIRQRITLDAHKHPKRSVWFDDRSQPVHTLTIAGHSITNGFVLPRRVDLSAPTGHRVSVKVDRYETNASFNGDLFSPALPSS